MSSATRSAAIRRAAKRDRLGRGRVEPSGRRRPAPARVRSSAAAQSRLNAPTSTASRSTGCVGPIASALLSASAWRPGRLVANGERREQVDEADERHRRLGLDAAGRTMRMSALPAARARGATSSRCRARPRATGRRRVPGAGVVEQTIDAQDSSPGRRAWAVECTDCRSPRNPGGIGFPHAMAGRPPSLGRSSSEEAI